MILAHLLPKSSGFYVDVGAFHPVKFSNTYLFYKKGWRGINIDAAPGVMTEFNKLRSEDTNIAMGVSDEEGLLTFYLVDRGSSVNTFNYENLKMLGLSEKIREKIKVPVKRLENILNESFRGSPEEIDFLSIDVEGYEVNIIKSNNWTKYRPKVILIESFETMNHSTNFDRQFIDYLKPYGYTLFSKTPNSIFFLRSDLRLSPTNSIVSK